MTRSGLAPTRRMDALDVLTIVGAGRTCTHRALRWILGRWLAMDRRDARRETEGAPGRIQHAETISIRGRCPAQDRPAELAGSGAPDRGQRLLHAADAGFPAAATGAGPHLGHCRRSHRPAHWHMGVRRAAAPGLDDGVGGALPVGAHGRSLRARNRHSAGRGSRTSSARRVCPSTRQVSGWPAFARPSRCFATSTAPRLTRPWQWPSVVHAPGRWRPRSRTR